MINASRRICFEKRIVVGSSISVAYPSKQTRMKFIQYAKWSALQGASVLKKSECSASVFLLFTPQNKHVWISFNTQNDQRFKAHLLLRTISHRLQYFCCLPLKTNTYGFHSIRKMISASRRIFFEEKAWSFNLLLTFFGDKTPYIHQQHDLEPCIWTKTTWGIHFRYSQTSRSMI